MYLKRNLTENIYNCRVFKKYHNRVYYNINIINNKIRYNLKANK